MGRLVVKLDGQHVALAPFIIAPHSALRLPAENYSRGHHDHRLHGFYDYVSKAEAGLELSRRVYLSRCGCLFRLCVQGTRTNCLNCQLKITVSKVLI